MKALKIMAMAAVISMIAASCGSVHMGCPTYGNNISTKHGHKAQAKYSRGKRV